jgi:transposase
MINTGIVDWLLEKYRGLAPALNEKSRRRWAAVEATSLGRGGICAVSAATGLSRTTIYSGIRELQNGTTTENERIRRHGAGRKSLTSVNPDLQSALNTLIEDSTRGDPQTPLRWTCKSVRRLSEELKEQGHFIAFRSVANLLHNAGYSLQANRKVIEGSSHPDRDTQFRHINKKVIEFQKHGEAVVPFRWNRNRCG